MPVAGRKTHTYHQCKLHWVIITTCASEVLICAVAGRKNTTNANCNRSGPATVKVGVGYINNMQLQPPLTRSGPARASYTIKPECEQQFQELTEHLPKWGQSSEVSHSPLGEGSCNPDNKGSCRFVHNGQSLRDAAKECDNHYNNLHTGNSTYRQIV